ncbi:MAG TPA: xyloglucanase, partial [Thermoguttaceae bacterium]
MLLSAQAYDWNSVTIKANGFIDGIVYNPAAPDTVYIHTDMGGAYRWDQTDSKWMPMNDWSQWNDWSPQNLGVETLAVDPTDANRVYMAAGTYMSPTAIMRSTDGGRTWLRTDVSGINSNGNGSARNAGERMNVDPNSPNILYYGTRDDGLWKSTDYGASWARVTAFPSIGDDSGFSANTGIVWTLFDKSSSTPGTATQTIYAGVVEVGAGDTRIYRTTNGGST